MSSDVVIRAEGLGKKYMIGHQSGERYTSLRDVMAQTARSFARTAGDMFRGKAIIAGDEVEEFWALKDVNFEIKRGDVVGIIGRNGAGKSTLLKVLSRITEPSEGRVEIKGRIASLLEVGTGFHPELTGRENIYLNGAILGMSRGEIKRKFDEIVDFSGVEKFLDTPVKRYSSGMYVRLAFAVAAHLEPEILIVDEVLAVGDAEFQKKCLGKMKDVAGHGRTVLFVSHNMASIQALCSQSILLAGGHVELIDATHKAIERYLSKNNAKTVLTREDACTQEDPAVYFISASVEQINQTGQAARLTILYEVKTPISNLRVGFILHNQRGEDIFETYDLDRAEVSPVLCVGEYRSVCWLPTEFLGEGQFLISLNIGIYRERNILFVEHALSFEVPVNATGLLAHAQRRGVCQPAIAWERMGVSYDSEN